MSPMEPGRRAQAIKAEAARLGFDDCRVARAGFLEQEAPRLERWLREGMHGQMGYMASHFDLRLDPRKLVPGARSVIMLAHNYFPERTQSDPSAPVLAKYAYGQDYHPVLKAKMRQLWEFMARSFGAIEGRCFVDSAPVLERAWAERAGLGWRGKNSLLLNARRGSFFFLSEIVCDLDLPPDPPVGLDACARCRKCIDACPTQAIAAEGVVDARKCISYFTIELKGRQPEAFRGQFANRVFGCDICQDVCPYNRRARPHGEPAFAPRPGLLELDREGWRGMDQELFQELFRGSAVKRAKFDGLRRSIDFLLEDAPGEGQEP